MKQVYEEMVQLLLTSSVFTAMFNDRLDAVYARENTEFPFAVYTPQPTNAITKDAVEYSINLGFYFGNDYPKKNQPVPNYTVEYDRYTSQQNMDFYKTQPNSGQTSEVFSTVVTPN